MAEFKFVHSRFACVYIVRPNGNTAQVLKFYRGKLQSRKTYSIEGARAKAAQLLSDGYSMTAGQSTAPAQSRFVRTVVTVDPF